MIIVTGAAGFIGSCLLEKLNNCGIEDIVLVDNFIQVEKKHNYSNKKYLKLIDRLEFFNWANKNYKSIDFIFHIGARTDTAEFNMSIFEALNIGYSKKIWEFCTCFNIPLIYASSAATYGDGTLGYDDEHELVFQLKPLNPYGISKNEFDKWVLRQENTPPSWYGLKFFNVFGPNEYHKGRMASMIFHAFNQIRNFRKVSLFRSHIPEYKDGYQLRDFIYVKDVVNVIWFLFESKRPNGIYNLGTGISRSFIDLITAVFHSMGAEINIDFIDTPLDIRDHYQYFTEAKMDKLRKTGYSEEFYTLEEGIDEYVKKYLNNLFLI